MKILIAHNHYQYQGGEDTVVNEEMALLRQHGHIVEFYGRSNHELTTMSKPVAAISTVWSRRSVCDLDAIIGFFQPDIIHVHNTFPLISPSLYWAAAHRNIPLVQTLHNFRLLCPQAMLFRNGSVCEDCIGKAAWRAIPRKCYRGSVLQSAVAVGMLAGHRMIGTFRDKPSFYIVLNAFCKEKFIQGGLPAELLRIKPNFVSSKLNPGERARKGGLFVGRLSPEKGIPLLIDAKSALNGVSIQMIGAGPLEKAARHAFGEDFLGFQPAAEIRDRMASVQFLIVPSIGLETFGMVVIEAFSCGTPVIASRLGGLEELIEDGVTGLLAPPGDARALAEKIAWAETHPKEMQRMGKAARMEYEIKYTPERNYRMLMEIYEDAIAAASTKAAGLVHG